MNGKYPPFGQQPSGDPFAPETIDEQIETRLRQWPAHLPPDDDTRLLRALADAYRLPAAAQGSMAHAYERVLATPITVVQPLAPRGSGALVRKQHRTLPFMRNASHGTGAHGPLPGAWAGVVALLVVALLVAAFARLVVLRPSPNTGPPLATEPPTGMIYDLSLSCPSTQPTCDLASHLPATIGTLTQRTHDFGYGYAAVTQTGATTLHVKVPGANGDDDSMRAVLDSVGNLTILDTNGTQLPVGTTVKEGQYPVAFTGSQLDRTTITATMAPGADQPVVAFAFAGDAKTQFAQYTQAHIGDYLTLVLDHQVIESATIQSEIDTSAQVGGFTSLDQAKALAAILKGGPLALAVRITSATPYPASAPTLTPAQPTTTPFATPTTPASTFPAYESSGCSVTDPSKHTPFTQVGAMAVSVPTLSGLAFPSALIPSGTPNGPYQVPITADEAQSNVITPNPQVNPGAIPGYGIGLCNKTSAKHSLTAIMVTITSFTPSGGTIAVWHMCDGGPYDALTKQTTNGCGGGWGGGLGDYTATLPSDTVGASTPASVGQMGTALPVVIDPGQSTYFGVSLKGLNSQGTYKFSISVGIDGAASVALTPSDPPIMIAPNPVVWTGAACKSAAMQAKIPPATKDTYYVCPPGA